MTNADNEHDDLPDEIRRELKNPASSSLPAGQTDHGKRPAVETNEDGGPIVTDESDDDDFE